MDSQPLVRSPEIENKIACELGNAADCQESKTLAKKVVSTVPTSVLVLSASGIIEKEY